VRLEYSDAATIAEVLESTKAHSAEACDHEEKSLDQIMKMVEIEASGSRHPLFQTMLAIAPQDCTSSRRVASSADNSIGENRTCCDLVLTIRAEGTGLSGNLSFSTNLFDERTAERIVQSYRLLLEGMATDATQTISELAIVSEDERRLMLTSWNATNTDEPVRLCVHELFEARAVENPQRKAVAFAGRNLTYAELNANANRLAHKLREMGVEPDDRVAICVERGPEMVVAMLGAMKAGGCYVPLDPAYPADRLRMMVSDSGAKVLLNEVSSKYDWACTVPQLAIDGDLGGQPATNPRPARDDPGTGKLAYVIYTSGSTGRPKAVMVEHSNLVNLLEDWSCRFSEWDHASPLRGAMWANYNFDVSVLEIFGTLTAGGTLNIVPESVRSDPAALLDWLTKEDIHFGFLPPFFVRCVNDMLTQSDRQLSLKRLLVGVEPISETDLFRLQTKTPGLEIVNAYGPSEATVYSTAYQDIGNRERNAPIGKPVANATVHILDKHRHLVPVGVAGEIHIGGAGVARGYLNRPALSAERFIADPFSGEADARLYKTGDLGRWLTDGTIEFLGRDDFQVKIRGFRVELGEIESRLMELPEVTEAAVLARKASSGSKRLVAYCAGFEPLYVDTLRETLACRLPDYMVPAAFVRMKRLPRTSNGKLDRDRLPAPQYEDFVSQAYEAPQTDAEKRVAHVWANLLNLDRIGRHDNFFELGGNSLLVTRCIARLRRSLQVAVPFRTLFDQPVLSEFSIDVAKALPSSSTIIRKAARDDILAASFSQQRLWLLSAIEGASKAYHVSCGWELRGSLDVSVLKAAMNRIVARHDVLRTTFGSVDGRPVQRVSAPSKARALSFVEQQTSSDEELEALTREEANLSFDLEHGPLIRARLLHKGKDAARLLVSMHHIVSDGWSMRVFARELNNLYGALLEGSPDPLPSLPIQYADFSAWQRDSLSADRLRDGQAYWKKALSDAPERLVLPSDYSRPAVQDFSGDRVDFALGREQSRLLREDSLDYGTTSFVFAFAAWAALLSRLSGQQDVVIGAPAANREHADVEDLIGFFVNTLALRVDLTGDQTVAELLQQVKERTLEGQDHQDIPFEKVVELINPPRSSACSPLFQVMFAWEDDDEMHLELPGVNAGRPISINDGTAQFDLILTMRKTPKGIEGELEFATALFKRETVERWIGYYRRLLAGMLYGRSYRINDIPILPELEYKRLVHDWAATDLPRKNAERISESRGFCLHEMFEEQARRHPDATALVSGNESLSYAELNRHANRLANRLRALDIKPETSVAICLKRGIEMVVAPLAILKAGGAYVPLDPQAPLTRRRHVLQDSGAVALLTRSSDFPELTADVDDDFSVVDLSQSFESWSDANPDRAETGIAPGHLAYLIYTSGSTGKPKGVMVEHRNIVSSTLARQHVYGRTGTFLHLSPLHFDSSVAGIFGTLAQSGTLVVADERAMRNPSQVCRLVDHEKIETLLCVPSVYEHLVKYPEFRAGARHLQTVIVAGESCPVSLVKQSAEQYPHVTVYNEYGPTEATVWATFHCCRSDEDGESVPIGRPVPGSRVYVLDADGRPMPTGVAGEICIGGNGVARGYLNRPDQTKECFVPDPFDPEAGARMYRTGDIGRWRSGGSLEFVGRNDFQIKVRGMRIEIGEIEKQLLAQPQITETAVVSHDTGHGEQRLTAYLVTTHKHNPAELRDTLIKTLPEYMVPVAFVRMDALPRTSNGKLNQSALPTPETADYATNRYEAPRDDTEETVAAIWSALLGIQRVGRRDNFFSLGGHSLLAIQVTSRLRTTLGVDVPLSALFDAPVLADFAAVVSGAETTRLPPVTPVDRPRTIPLSMAQRRLWFVSQLEGGNAAYNIPLELCFQGSLDKQALRLAMHRIVARHETLRTNIIVRNGEPGQTISPPRSGSFDLREMQATNSAEMREIALNEERMPFDLAHDSLIRGVLVEEEAGYTLLITIHHIVADGWSMGRFMTELGALYTAYASNASDPLAPLYVQYADYVLWQERHFADRVLEEQADYWRTTLAGAPALLSLPTDYSRPPQQEYAGGTVTLSLDVTLTRDLKALVSRHGITLYMGLLTAWTILLSRLSGQTDLVIGTPAANRDRNEIEPLIGLFVNTLPFRMDMSEKPSVAALLEQVGRTTLAARKHHDLPFERVVETINPTRSAAYNPLFQVMFAWDGESPDPQTAFHGLRTRQRRRTDYGIAKFDLTLFASKSGGGIDATLEYASSLFKRSTVERFATYFEMVLREMIKDDQQSVARLPVMPAQERRQVVETWNNTGLPYRRHRCIHELFEEQVEAVPDAPAVECGRSHMTYAELNGTANRLAQRLSAYNLRPDDRVAVCVERSLDMVVAILAVLKAGAAYVPLDPEYPEERLRYIVEDSAPAVFLSNGGYDRIADEVPVLTINTVRSGEDVNLPANNARLSPDSLAYVIYTSGSTGRPKGVMVEHGNACNMVVVQREALELEADSRVLQFASFSFDACVFETLIALCTGATLVIPESKTPLTGDSLLRFANASAITHTVLPPAVLATLPDDGKFKTMKVLLSGGDVLSSEAARRWSRSHRLVNAYGPTETTVMASMQECTGDMVTQPPIGRPIGNTRIYILDEHQAPVPVGVTGELYIGGAGVARGYLGRPELTRDRFPADPFDAVPNARMYKTGDLGRWREDGVIEYLGRNDFQVKVRGFRIDVGEIEKHLQEHPDVQDAVVLAHGDSPENTCLAAYCVAADELGTATLASYLSDRLPAYMVPAAFVQMQALPLTPNGKPDRKAFPDPDDNAYVSRDYEAPEGETEMVIAEIWADLLARQRVGRRDNFFDLGGHSLLATKMVSRLRAEMKVEVALGAIFEHPTLVAFAQIVSTAAPVERPSVKAVERRRHMPVSFAQRRQWFLAQISAAATAYHIPYGVRLEGDVDTRALKNALNSIVARHESLRTTFVNIEGEPAQRIVTIEDSRFSLDEKVSGSDATTEQLIADEVTARFDLERGPLIRGLLIRESDSCYVLLVTMHHIVSDGRSMGVFLNELSTLYKAFSKGQPDPLPWPEVQYTDYAVWQRQWLSEEALDSQATYWKDTLAGAPERLTLHTDHPRPVEQNYSGDSVPVVLDETMTRSLKRLSRRHGTTLFMTIIAAWAALLSRLSGQEDVVVGTPTANRGDADIEGIIGFFVNTLALRMDLTGDPDVSEFLDRVRACTLNAQENQDIPFEQVVEHVNPLRSVSHSPLFQAAFSWENNPVPDLHLPGLTSAPVEELQYKVAKFDLSLSLSESQGRIEGALEYATALFERSSAEQIIDQFRNLLEGMIADASRPLNAIPILSARERRLVTETWNATEKAFPTDVCIHELFESQVERTPDEVAVAFAERTLSYAELNRRANQLAHRLREMDLKPDDRVAICLPRGTDQIIGLLGILKAGGAYVAMDPAYPEERLKHMLVDSAPVALLVSGSAPEWLIEKGNDSPPIVDLTESLSEQLDTNPGSASTGLGAGHLAYLIYTSGSTGTPKGVMVEHRNVVNLVMNWLEQLDEDTQAKPLNTSSWTSFSFDASVFELFTTLTVGGTVNLVPDDIRGEPSRLYDWFCEKQISAAYLPPFFVRQMDDLMGKAEAIPPFKYLLVGVEPLIEAQLFRIQTANPEEKIKLLNGYGPSETTVFSTAYDEASDIHRNAPIGRPISNTQTYILNNHRQPVPVGVTGELYIGGAGVARGYINRPNQTAERFVTDPFSARVGARMYKTGDLARWMPDGNIEFQGRNDDQVKIRGFRVELGEIEARLSEQPGIREAAVVAHADSASDKTLVAYYISPHTFKSKMLREHLSATLPKYMLPRAFVRMDAFPQLPNGKLDKKALPKPDLAPVRSESEFVAPRNDCEARIAAIWSDVLDIPDISIDDNFFDLGGESFKAFRVVGRIGEGIGVTELFKYPTVRLLAERVLGGRRDSGRLLHELAGRILDHEHELTLVCIPFPGGGPISYQRLARDLPKGYAALGLELPGHDFGRPDEKPLPIEEIARRCAEEIRDGVTGPIAIYGHCGGGALTVALAFELERLGFDIERLFIGGHFPTPHLPSKFFEWFRRVLPVHKWASERTAFDLLKSFGFFDETSDSAQQDFVMGNFVREHQEIDDYYTMLYRKPIEKLDTPITCVIGEMDRATQLYQERYLEWEYFSDSVDLAVIPKAGHYFIKHQAEELGEIIENKTLQPEGNAVISEVQTGHPQNKAAPTVENERAKQTNLKAFFTVAIGEIISVIGSTLTSFGLGVWVYEQTGLVSTYALMMIFIILPAIALSPIAGTLADRIDRKRLMIASNCLAGLSTATAAVLIFTGSLQIWLVFVLAGVTAVANAFRLPAYTAMITQIVPKRYYGKANGIVQLGTGMGAFVGPALAGALIGAIGLKGIVMADFVTFLIAISALLAAYLPDSMFEKREESFLKEMIGGWSYISKRHSLVAMIVMVTIANYFVGLIEALITPLVLSSGDPESLGIVMGANGFGILAGSVLMGLWGGTRSRINGILASTMLSGICLVLTGANPATLVQAAGMFGFGFCLALVNAHWIATLQAKVGLELQGRVVATNFMLMEAMVPLGYFSAGPLADQVFGPLMAQGGAWASTFGALIGAGPSRGMGLILVFSGGFVVLWAITAYLYRPIRCLEEILPDARADEVIEPDKDKLQKQADMVLDHSR
jgi:amino acid adenylation domain-containing protein